MNFRVTQKYQRQLRKLRVPPKIQEQIYDFFEELDSERASQIPYYKAGQYKKYKKIKRGKFRLFFSYCQECFGKYDHHFNCEFCNEDDLEQIVLFNIEKRAFDYK